MPEDSPTNENDHCGDDEHADARQYDGQRAGCVKSCDERGVIGLGCGLITVFIRYFGSYPEGVCYSILIMNCCTWIIDKYTKPTRFGVDKKAKKEAAK